MTDSPQPMTSMTVKKCRDLRLSPRFFTVIEETRIWAFVRKSGRGMTAQVLTVQVLMATPCTKSLGLSACPERRSPRYHETCLDPEGVDESSAAVNQDVCAVARAHRQKSQRSVSSFKSDRASPIVVNNNNNNFRPTFLFLFLLFDCCLLFPPHAAIPRNLFSFWNQKA